MKIQGYTIETQIGQGGMAVVYRAIQQSLGRPVALKVMNPLLANSDEFSERFLNEGRLLATLHHSHIMTIYDIGVSDGWHYLSMEYVDGGDLKQRIRHGIASHTALDYIITLSSCLKAAHAAQIVHRDIKPVNILFRDDGTLLLADFGVAKQLTSLKELTTTGSIVGSPYYLSPEQALGKNVDYRADIYSLGIVFYEMLVGDKPFEGTSAIDVAMKHIKNPLPRLPQTLAHFQPLLDRMTAKEPRDRFNDAAHLLDAAQYLRGRGAWSDALRVATSKLEQTLILQEHPGEEVVPGRQGLTSNTVSADGLPWRQLSHVVASKKFALAAVIGGLTLAGLIFGGRLGGVKQASITPEAIKSIQTVGHEEPRQLGKPSQLTESSVQPSMPEQAAQVNEPREPVPSGQLVEPRLLVAAFEPAPLIEPEELSAQPLQRRQTVQALEPREPVPSGQSTKLAPPVEPVLPVLLETPTQPAPLTKPEQFSTAPAASGQTAQETALMPVAVPAETTASVAPVQSDARPPAVPGSELLQQEQATLSLAQAEQVKALLRAAQEALDDYRLTTPANNCAYDYYQQAQDLDPNNSQARAGFGYIADRYLTLAQSVLNKGQRTKAQYYVNLGLNVQSDHAGLLALDDRLKEPVRTSRRQERNGVGQSVNTFFRDVKNFFRR